MKIRKTLSLNMELMNEITALAKEKFNTDTSNLCEELLMLGLYAVKLSDYKDLQNIESKIEKGFKL